MFIREINMETHFSDIHRSIQANWSGKCIMGGYHHLDNNDSHSSRE